MALNEPLNQPLMSASDPFYAVRDALEAEVQALKIKFDEWKNLLYSVNTASDTKFAVKDGGTCYTPFQRSRSTKSSTVWT